MMNKLNSTGAQVQIYDLKDDQGNATGTKGGGDPAVLTRELSIPFIWFAQRYFSQTNRKALPEIYHSIKSRSEK